jgi:hypothetical protein
MKNKLQFLLIYVSILMLILVPEVRGQYSGVWSGRGAVWTSTSDNGVMITATYSGQIPATIKSDYMGCNPGSFSDPAITGKPSLFQVDDITKPTTLVFTFSEEVVNPILHIDKLGNRSENRVGSVKITYRNGTWTQLSSNGPHFVSTSTTVQRAVTTSNQFYVECGAATGSQLGSASGSLRINGTVSRIELYLTDGGNSWEGDEHEFSFSNLVLSPKGRFTCSTGGAVLSSSFTNSGSSQNATLTVPVVVSKAGEVCFNITGLGFDSSPSPYCTTVTATQTSIDIPVTFNGQGGSGNRTLYYYSAEGCSGDVRINISENCLNPSVGGSTTLTEGASPFCSITNSGTVSLNGQTGNVVRWETSTNGTSWSSIAHTGVSYTFTNAANGQQYRAIVKAGSGCAEAASSPTVIAANPTVCCPNPSVAGTLTYNGGTLCNTSANSTISLSGHTGNVEKWQTSTNGGTSWTDIPNTTTSLNFTNAANGQQYRAVVKATGATCSEVFTSPVTITTNVSSCCPVPASGGTLALNPAGPLCITYARGTLTLSGHDGVVAGWQTSVNGGGTWTNINGTTGLTSFDFSGAQNNQQYRVRIEKAGCSEAYSSVVTVITSADQCTFSTDCDSDNGTITISRTTPATGTNLVTRLVAVDNTGKIIAVSATGATTISSVPAGSYMVYEVSYDSGEAPAFTLGSGFNIAESSCFKVSNPVPFKVCLKCDPPAVPLALSYPAGSVVTVQKGQEQSFTVTGGATGGVTWKVSPTTGVSPEVSGPGLSTGPLKFDETGAYVVTFTSSNSTSPAGCNVPYLDSLKYEVAVIPAIPCNPVIPGQIETFADKGLVTGNKAYFTYTPQNPANTVSWYIVPNTSAVPGAGTGSQTPMITFTNQGEYEIVFVETNHGEPEGCTIPSTGQASIKFVVKNPAGVCPDPGSAAVTIMPPQAAVAVGGTGNFTMTGGQPYQNVQWFATPQNGVTPVVSGSGASTGNLVFTKAGLYRVSFVYTNAGDLTCLPTQRVVSGLISVGMDPCTPPSPITVLNQTAGDTIAVGSSRTFNAVGGVPGIMTWKVSPVDGGATPQSGSGSTAAITFNQAGKYIVTFTSTNGSIPLGCTSPVSVSSSKEIVVLPNLPPVLVPNPIITEQDKPKTVCMPFSDLNTNDVHRVEVTCSPDHGTVTATVNQTNKTVCVTYTPNPGYSGTDKVCIKLCDGTDVWSECNEYEIPVTVVPKETPSVTNVPPVIVPVPIVTDPNTPITVCMPIQDPNIGDIFTVTKCVPQAAKGTVSTPQVTGDVVCITYTPTNNQTGRDELCLRVCDDKGACTNTMVPVIIQTPNYHGPKLTPTTVVTPENTPVSVCTPIIYNGSDSQLEVIICGQPAKGTIDMTSVSATGEGGLCFTFIPNPGQTGTDKVCFEICDSEQRCDQRDIPIWIIPGASPSPVYNPDNNVTYVNVPVPGNVKTNDKDVKPGSTYGTPVALSGNPAGCVPAMIPATGNTTGEYTFTCATPGVYNFTVPVCEAAPSTTCTNVPLTITVLDKDTPSNNGPVANPDYAETKGTTPVTLPTLSNDKPGDPDKILVPGTVTIVTPPANGTATVNPTTGDITYTPNSGFTGTDQLTYQVCDNATPAKCAQTVQVITVKPANAPNTTVAVDDYYTTDKNTPVSGNVKTNDRDPEGNTQTVTPQNTTSPGKGTLVLNNDGTFTFTPVTGYTGPVSFPYTTCDNGTPQACASATLYVMVEEVPVAPVYNPDNNVTYKDVPVNGDLKTNDKDVPSGATYGPTVTPKPGNPSNCLPVVSSNGTYTFTCSTPGDYHFTVPVCTTSPAVCVDVPLTITVLDKDTPSNNGPVANPDYAETKGTTPVTLPTLSNDKPGDPDKILVPGTVTIVTPPANGTATVNPTTGDITYTPNSGFTGTDQLTYQVCDNATPAKCAQTVQVITVKPANAPNTTVAVDDYYTTDKNTPVSGNVKTNDRDPEGNTQTVTPQNTTSPGKGTLVLNNDGTFTFTPVTGYTGPVSFPYTTCDNGTPQACASATLYVMVEEVPVVCIPDLNPAIEVVPGSGITGSVRMGIQIDIKELLGCDTDPTKPIQFTVSKSPNFTFNWSGFANATSVPYFDFTGLENSDWTFAEVGSLYIWTYNKPVFNANSISNIGFEGIWNAGTATGTQNFTVTILNGSGGEVRLGNNLDVARIRHTTP